MKNGKVYLVGATKGGVGKSVSSYNLAYSLAKLGKKVLAVDFDSQANMSTCFGVEDTAAVPITIGHLMMNQIEDEEMPAPEEFIRSRNGVDFIPSSMVLSVVDAKLRLEMGAEKMLSNILEPLKEKYDAIIIDTCPALGALTINALAAADGVIITVKVAGVIKAVQGAFAALNATMLANPIVLIIAAIAALVAAFIYLWNTNEEFRQFWIDLWEDIKEIAVAVWEGLKEFFSAAWEAIRATAETVWNAIAGFLTGLWEGIRNTFNTVVNAISSFLSTAWNTIQMVATTVWTAISTFFSTISLCVRIDVNEA